jgi:hypothetical protein
MYTNNSPAQDCADNKTSEVSDFNFFIASNVIKQETIEKTNNLMINNKIEENKNSGFNIVSAKVTTHQNNSTLTTTASISNNSKNVAFISGKVFEGLPYYAIHMSLNRDILNANFLTDILSIRKNNKTFKAPNYSYSSNYIIDTRSNSISLRGNAIDKSKGNHFIASNIIEETEEITEINIVEHSINKTGNININSKLFYNKSNQSVTANIVHNSISLKGYVNGEYVLQNSDELKNKDITINEGWNIIAVPYIIHNKPAKVKDFIDKISQLLKKETYEVFELALFIENNKETTFVISKNYITGNDSPNNFCLYKKTDGKTYSRPFMIKSKINFSFNTKEIM